MKIIEIKEEVQIGNIILEKGDKIKVLEEKHLFKDPLNLVDLEYTFDKVKNMKWEDIKSTIANADNTTPTKSFPKDITVNFEENFIYFKFPHLWKEDNKTFKMDIHMVYDIKSKVFKSDYDGQVYK